MEIWFLLAISFAIFHSFVSLVDKILLKEKLDPTALSSFRLATNAAVIFIIFILFFNQEMSLNWLVILISIIFSISALCYFSALKTEDVSKLIPFRESIATTLSFFIPLVFLRETVSVYDYAGVLAIVLGSYAILTNGKIIFPQITRGLVLIGINAITISLVGVISKIALATVHPVQLTFLIYAFVALWLVVFNLIWNRKRQFETIRLVLRNNKLLLLSLLSSVSAVLGFMALFFALSMRNASEVLPLSGTLPLFAALSGWIFLKEKYGPQRLFWALVMVGGMYFIYL